MSDSDYSMDALSYSFDKMNASRNNSSYQEFKGRFMEVLCQMSVALGMDGEEWLEMMTINFDDLIIERAYLKIREINVNSISKYIEIVNGTLSSTASGYYWNYVLYDIYTTYKFFSIPELLKVFNEMTDTNNVFENYIRGRVGNMTPIDYIRLIENAKLTKVAAIVDIWYMNEENYNSFFQWLPQEIVETTLDLFGESRV